MKRSALIPAISLALLATPAALADDPVQTAATAVIGKLTPHSLTLTLTRKADGNDKSFEATAIAINGSGLLATSLKATEGDDPVAGMMAMMSDTPAKDAGELTRVAWIREDATEIEGELVLKDELLDLAIIRLKPGDGVTMPAAPTMADSAPVLLDNTLAIGRFSADFQRAPRIGLGQVSALVTTPRELYQVSGDPAPGTPVYNLAGKCIGLAVQIENETLVVPAAAILKRAESVPASENP
jgi:hypothetical protein